MVLMAENSGEDPNQPTQSETNNHRWLELAVPAFHSAESSLHSFSLTRDISRVSVLLQPAVLLLLLS